MTNAQFWSPVPDHPGKIRCELCPHICLIPENAAGDCGVRRNENGVLLAKTFGEISSLAIDPIEKKPLYHFYPSQSILSLGSWGCNLHCAFCQNWRISQQSAPAKKFSPDNLITHARANKINLIAYTYNEPFVNFEFIYDCCAAARAAGMKNIIVTNGYYNPVPLEKLLPLVDAMNVDLKAFTNDFYQRHCGGEIAPVLATLRRVSNTCHLEITLLLIENENNAAAELSAMAEFIAENCGDHTPLHLSAYFPQYHFTAPPTTLSALKIAQTIFRRRLHWVYLGNVAESQNSDCPRCGNLLIRRTGYAVEICGLRDSKSFCAHCGEKLNFILGCE